MESTIDTEVLERAKKIKLLALDVDGVLTDGRIFFLNSGEEIKAFSTLDGQGIKMLRKSGVEVAIITGRESQLVEKRARDLGIRFLIQGREDKLTALNELLEEFPCELEAIAFLGDDYPDLAIMTQVGLSLTVPNAHEELLSRSHWQTRRKGGEGAVRDACDLIMKAQNTYADALSPYLNA